MKLDDWSKLKKRFKNNLLLGNGASIAIDSRLSYRSLYEQVCESGKLNDELLNMLDSPAYFLFPISHYKPSCNASRYVHIV